MVFYITSTPKQESTMFRTQSPSPVAFVERRLTPRRGDDGALIAPQAAARIHRERDFGVGYGNSSGYALSKRYTSDWASPRFRCA